MKETTITENWWFFCADYESPESRSIIYACFVPIADKITDELKNKIIDLGSHCKLNINSKIITSEVFENAKENLNKNIIDFSIFFSDAFEKHPVNECHSYIQKSFGYNAVAARIAIQEKTS